jgi:hypothetical protein
MKNEGMKNEGMKNEGMLHSEGVPSGKESQGERNEE